MTSVRGRAAASASAVLAALALASCSSLATGGPLTGPRIGESSVQVCAPAGSDRDVYFGEPLTNHGEAQVTVTEVRGSGDNVSSVSFGVDLEGAALGQITGTFAVPAPATNRGHGEEILARMVAPGEATIEPGAVANLIFAPEPTDASAELSVSLIEVDYMSGGKSYREQIRVVYTLRPGDHC